MLKHTVPIRNKIVILVALLTAFLFITVYLPHNSFAHNYSPNELASFLAFTDEFVAEIDLVQSNLATSNFTLSQEHADKASKLFYRNIVDEFAERDPDIGDEIGNSIKTLQNLSFFSSASNANMSHGQQNQVNEIIDNIKMKIDNLIDGTIIDQQNQGANLLDYIMNFFTGIIGMEKTDSLIGNHTTIQIQALRLVELLDLLLENYGRAFSVEFDMTDMSNMANMNMEMNMSEHNRMTSIADYQSAHALVISAMQLFTTELKSVTSNENSTITTNHISKIDEGLGQLNIAINEKSTPENVMMIVHSQIHPNLQAAFNLSLKQ